MPPAVKLRGCGFALAWRQVDAILVIHAHSDHTETLPIVHHAFPSAPIHLTPPTAVLVAILQRGALRLMDSPDRKEELPLDTERQVEAMREALVPVPHGESVTIGDLDAPSKRKVNTKPPTSSSCSWSAGSMKRPPVQRPDRFVADPAPWVRVCYPHG
ncbi:MAG: hypothetical protein AMXMBFR64_26960 [Myxococcales bacterium]